MITELPQRFIDKIKFPDEPNGCWEWTASKNKGGYGRSSYTVSGTTHHIYAHRLSYAILRGSIGQEMVVMHTCDNPSCVNPQHLELGTHADNAQDRDRKGRNSEKSRTHCPQGHEYSEENTYVHGTHRYCRECNRISHRQKQTT